LLVVAVSVQADPEGAAEREIGSQLPFGADATRRWWIGAVAVIRLVTRRLRLFLAMTAGAIALALAGIALYVGEPRLESGWTAYHPSEVADLIQHPLGDHAVTWWWGAAALVIALAGAGLLVAGPGKLGPATMAVVVVALCVLFGAIRLHSGDEDLPVADPWWLLAAAATAALFAALASGGAGRPDAAGD
jgi:hypothetical protein